jgi:tRNA pseudouridine38-40 synthase
VNAKRNIKLLLAFDGTGYEGWQKQKSGKTIQGVIEDRLSVMTGEQPCIYGAGRTDAGVHALGMVANFHTDAKIPCQGFMRGLNSMLPDDIRVLEACEVQSDFHARRNAKAKSYRYNFSSGPVQFPTERLYSVHISKDLDIEAMKNGLGCLVGTYDYTSFEGAGSREPEVTGKGAVRTIFEASLHAVGTDGNHRIIIKGDGFLRHMVRNIVGTVFEIGKGKLSPIDIIAILAAKDRSAAGPTAPARGLFLKEVFYS